MLYKIQRVVGVYQCGSAFASSILRLGPEFLAINNTTILNLGSDSQFMDEVVFVVRFESRVQLQMSFGLLCGPARL